MPELTELNELTESQKIYIQIIRQAIHDEMENNRHWAIRFLRDVLAYAVGVLKKL